MFKQGERRPIVALQSEVDRLRRLNKQQTVSASSYATKGDVSALSSVVSSKADAGAVSTALAAKADAAAMSTALAGKASTSAIPQPATAAPPAIGDASALGSTQRFALADHTHKSNVMSKRIQVAGTSGLAVWTFDTAFDVAPVVEVTAETPDGAAYLNVATVVEGTITVNDVKILVARVQKSITLPTLATALLGLVLTLFAPAPAGVWVNCIARKPS